MWSKAADWEITDPVKHEKVQTGWTDLHLSFIFNVVLMSVFVFCQSSLWLINLSVHVCVCVSLLFRMVASLLAHCGQGSKGHCPQLVMSPAIRSLFVPMVKTPQGHQLQLPSNFPAAAHDPDSGEASNIIFVKLKKCILKQWRFYSGTLWGVGCGGAGEWSTAAEHQCIPGKTDFCI